MNRKLVAVSVSQVVSHPKATRGNLRHAGGGHRLIVRRSLGGGETWGQDSPETYAVAAEVRGVVVAIRNPAVVGVVVPTAAA